MKRDRPGSVDGTNRVQVNYPTILVQGEMVGTLNEKINGFCSGHSLKQTTMICLSFFLSLSMMSLKGIRILPGKTEGNI